MELKEQILVALGLKKEEQEVNLGWQSKAEDGTIFVSTLDALEVGGDIAVLTEDGSTIPVPAGEYYTPDGGFKVVEDGVIAEVLEAEAVEEETEEVVEEEVVEAAEDEGDMETRLASLEKAVSELMEKLAEDKTEYKEEEVEVEEEVEASEVRGTTPKSIKTTEVVEFESLKAENERLKAELSKKPADSPINTNKFSSEKWVATKKDLSKMSQQDRFLYNLNR
ncbi:MAG TPA: hypothetical protein VMW50_03855 [Dehalococcoidia bacterium]|nr:hypothetical protein [Dehalococcoidia bacterium]